MNRILGIFAFSSVLLTACGGGGIQSPDFQPVLQGIVIAAPGDASNQLPTGAVTVAPSGTLQLRAQGLFSTPPGTKGGSGVVSCGTSFCTLGNVNGVVFNIDPPTTRTFATVDSNGLVTGVRRGQTTVRAQLTGFTQASRPLNVNGPVLKSIAITARDVKNNVALTAPATVPTGRTIQLTAVATCQTGSNGQETTTNCTNLNYNFSWQLPLGTPDGTAEFTPNPPSGRIIALKTKRFGSFNIEANLTNEEGDLVTGTAALNASARVLDDVIVMADPAQPAPVPVVKGATTRFVAKGLYSDGQIGDISAVDLAKTSGGTRTSLTWSADSNAVGQFEISQDTTTSPNAAILVTSQSSDRIGGSGITASGTNSESTPLLIEDRVPVDVREVDLLALTNICLRSDPPSQCSTNTPIELSATPTTAANATQYVVRGTFRGDAAGVERNVDPAQIPLVFTTGVDSANAGQIKTFTDVDLPIGTPDSTVSVVGSKTGAAQLIATLKSDFAPAISARTKSADIIVLESLCRDQLFTANGTTAAMTVTDTIGLSDATNAANVIDTSTTNFGTYTVGPSVLGGTLTMTFNRPDTIVTPAIGHRVSFVLNDSGDNITSLVSIQTFNAAGVQVENIPSAGITRATAQARPAGFNVYSAPVTLPFTGIRLTIKPPLLLGLLSAALPVGLIDILVSGGSFDVNAYTACANTR